jgi:hypothetical protein
MPLDKKYPDYNPQKLPLCDLCKKEKSIIVHKKVLQCASCVLKAISLTFRDKPDREKANKINKK